MGDAGAPRRKRKRPKTVAGRRRAETWRLKKLLAVEEEFWDRGIDLVAGIDEAGRGPLAGPVLAAAVILPPRTPIRGMDDSKRVPPERREALFDEIRDTAVAIAIGAASTREVDHLNILRASHLAMERALLKLTVAPQRVIIDGLPVPRLGTDHIAIIDGDEKVHCVACASIVAKVVRDRLMRLLSGRYPGYGWDHNAGYGTPDHRDAILSLGLTPHHRRSFEPNVQLTLELPT
ncbi:MAG: ribonuclease HII [Longimicrobiales bacterium]